MNLRALLREAERGPLWPALDGLEGRPLRAPLAAPVPADRLVVPKVAKVAGATEEVAKTGRRAGLARPHRFLSQLRLERRRAERSGRALSLILFERSHPQGAGDSPGGALLEALLAEKRETDVVSQLGRERVAVLCLDTDGAGLRGFLAKLQARLGDPPLHAFVPQSATFPDRLFDLVAGSLPSTADSLLVGVDELRRRRPPGYRGKRALDLLLGTLALLLLAPVMLLTALAIALDSPGPVIYRQPRLGLGGRAFTFFKFRSMHVNVDERIHRDFVLRLIERGEAETSPPDGASPTTYKLSADARITRVGRFIRRSSIDELPQLFNVLRGEMSLVGPRPPIPYEAERYQAWHLRRLLSLPPGITGLWQVEGRSRVGFNDMVRMDLRYLRKCSLALDLRILLRTVVVVVRGSGGG